VNNTETTGQQEGNRLLLSIDLYLALKLRNKATKKRKGRRAGESWAASFEGRRIASPQPQGARGASQHDPILLESETSVRETLTTSRFRAWLFEVNTNENRDR